MGSCRTNLKPFNRLFRSSLQSFSSASLSDWRSPLARSVIFSFGPLTVATSISATDDCKEPRFARSTLAPHPNPLPIKRGEGTCLLSVEIGGEMVRNVSFSQHAGRGVRRTQAHEGQNPALVRNSVATQNQSHAIATHAASATSLPLPSAGRVPCRAPRISGRGSSLSDAPLHGRRDNR